ncbi:regulator, partial [Streptomyces sp. NPDC127574]
MQRSQPARRSTPPTSGNLPLELDAFVGRSAELARLAELLESVRLVTVTGVGGVGKSRFAVHAAACADGLDAVHRVDLSAVHDPGLVEYAVLEALGLTDHTAKPPRQVLLGHLADRRLLLVLDGFEHLVEVTASL